MFYRFNFSILHIDEIFPYISLVDEHILWLMWQCLSFRIIFIPRKRLGLDDSLPSVRGSLVAIDIIKELRFAKPVKRLRVWEGFGVEVEHIVSSELPEFTFLFLQVWFEETNVTRLTPKHPKLPQDGRNVCWWSSFTHCMPGPSKLHQLSHLILQPFQHLLRLPCIFLFLAGFFLTAGQPTPPPPRNKVNRPY